MTSLTAYYSSADINYERNEQFVNAIDLPSLFTLYLQSPQSEANLSQQPTQSENLETVSFYITHIVKTSGTLGTKGKCYDCCCAFLIEFRHVIHSCPKFLLEEFEACVSIMIDLSCNMTYPLFLLYELFSVYRLPLSGQKRTKIWVHSLS